MSMRSVYIIKWSYRQIEIVKADYFDVSFRSLFDHQAKWARWALIYVDESWSLWRELSSSLYDHSAEWTKWSLIYVFVTHVNRSENRKTDRFTALHKCVYAQKLSRVFVMTVWMSYISCSACAKTLLSFCVCASFNALMIALSLLRFSTVCELIAWVKRCYCSVDVDEIVQLFWQA